MNNLASSGNWRQPEEGFSARLLPGSTLLADPRVFCMKSGWVRKQFAMAGAG